MFGADVRVESSPSPASDCVPAVVASAYAVGVFFARAAPTAPAPTPTSLSLVARFVAYINNK